MKNPSLKLIIGTGATKNFLDPKIAEQYFKNQIVNEPLIVTSVLQRYEISESISIPLFEEFKQSTKVKFYLFRFHNHFQGLIWIIKKTRGKNRFQ